MADDDNSIIREKYFDAVTSQRCTYDDIRIAVRAVARKRGWEVKP